MALKRLTISVNRTTYEMLKAEMDDQKEDQYRNMSHLIERCIKLGLRETAANKGKHFVEDS